MSLRLSSLLRQYAISHSGPKHKMACEQNASMRLCLLYLWEVSVSGEKNRWERDLLGDGKEWVGARFAWVMGKLEG